MTIENIILENNIVSFIDECKFTLSSGIKSPIYFDMRKLWSINCRERHFIKMSLLENTITLMGDKFVDGFVVVGIETGGIAPGILIADAFNQPFFYIRKHKKDHGTQQKIEGNIKYGKSILLIDDVITTGESIYHALNSLTDIVYKDIAILSIFEYGFDKADKIKSNITDRYKSLTSFNNILYTNFFNEQTESFLLKWWNETNQII